MNIPAELLQVYSAIMANSQDEQAIAAHLQNFVLDALAIEKAVKDAIDAAKQRAGQ